MCLLYWAAIVKLNLAIIVKTVPFLSLDNKPVQQKYSLLNVKDVWLPRAEKKKEQKQGRNHSRLDHSYNPDSKRKSDKKTRELSPDDSGELRALKTLPLSLVAKINPHISIITRPHPYR